MWCPTYSFYNLPCTSHCILNNAKNLKLEETWRIKKKLFFVLDDEDSERWLSHDEFYWGFNGWEEYYWVRLIYCYYKNKLKAIIMQFLKECWGIKFWEGIRWVLKDAKWFWISTKNIFGGSLDKKKIIHFWITRNFF